MSLIDLFIPPDIPKRRGRVIYVLPLDEDWEVRRLDPENARYRAWRKDYYHRKREKILKANREWKRRARAEGRLGP